MGAVGGLIGLAGGSGGTGFNPQSGTNAGQLNASYFNAATAQEKQRALLEAIQGQQGLQKQGDVYGQLQGVVSGQGPNPAKAQLAQATGANVANQAALMAGQRGAGANVGLLARQAGMQGANLQQQAAGQAATMQANQSLNALGQAGNMANTIAANQIGQTNANSQAAQGEQQILQGANNANIAAQGQLANTQLGGQQNLIGGLGNAIGGATNLFGKVTKPFAEGGDVESQSAFQGPQSMFGQFLASPQPTNIPSFAAAPKSKLSELGGASGPSETDQMNANQQVATNEFNNHLAAPTMPQTMPAMQLPAIARVPAASGGSVGDQLKSGGHVPGDAKVSGDSLKNDTVKALLSPGEIVIPRSVTMSGDPVRGAADFVRAVMAKKGKMG